MIGAALGVAMAIAAGGVVDVAVSTEGRATQRDVNTAADIDASVAQGGLVLRPGISAAVENELMAGSLGYAPALSLLSPLGDFGQTTFSLLHALTLRGDARLGRRVRLRVATDGTFGDLDPASAQAALQRSSGVLDPLLAIPYGALGVRAGASWDATRRFGVDIDGTFGMSSSLGEGTIPLTISPEVEAFAFWDLTRTDSILGGVNVQGSNVDGRGTFVGGGPQIGWRKRIGVDTGFSVTGGVGTYTAEDDEFTPVTVYLPRLSGRFSTVLDLAGDAAVEGGLRAGVSVINDPLGTLLENRASVSLEGGVRFTRDVALRGDLSAFAPAFAYAQRGPTSSTTLGARTLVAWAAAENVSFEAGLLGTTRFVEDTVATDGMLTVSVTAHAPILHTGGRPAGSGDARFDVGGTRVGEPPPPGATTIEEPEPLLEVIEEPTPPELVPPSGMLPPDYVEPADPSAPGSLILRPLTDEEKKKADEAKKKRRDGEAKGGDGADPAEPADAREEPKDEPKEDAKDEAATP